MTISQRGLLFWDTLYETMLLHRTSACSCWIDFLLYTSWRRHTLWRSL